MKSRSSFRAVGSVVSKAPRFLAEHAFFFYLFLILAFCIFATFLFYFYVWIPQREQPKNIRSNTQFYQNVFERVQQIRQDRAKNFQDADTFHPRNLFRYPM
ncbi:MAG: hypothetical protein HYW95_00125 [Candidatus Wildermuthbacteria bacterium]|nr:hypothetical protein [Candidatus Wildermuthbacteria bacterium]